MDIDASIADTRKGFEESFAAGDFYNRQTQDGRTLEYWRKVHTDFLTRELSKSHLTFSENTKVVCEEFELVYA